MEWIDINLKFPTVDERVLLTIECIGDRYVCIGRMDEKTLFFKDKGTLSRPMETVTHWSLLPKPPIKLK